MKTLLARPGSEAAAKPEQLVEELVYDTLAVVTYNAERKPFSWEEPPSEAVTELQFHNLDADEAEIVRTTCAAFGWLTL
jgi:hypothetical protein